MNKSSTSLALLFHGRFFRFYVFLCALAFVGAPHSQTSALGSETDSGQNQRVVLSSEIDLRTQPQSVGETQKLMAEAGTRISVIEEWRDPDSDTHWLRVRHQNTIGWIPEALTAPLPSFVASSDLPVIGTEPVDRYRGIDPGYVPTDLVEIAGGYDPDVKYRLRKPVATALSELLRAAKRDSIQLEIVSAYRSYEKQRSIYLRKLKRSGWNQKTVARPGHSEHQLGTTADFAGPDDSTLLRASFGDTPSGKWLAANAPRFGFAVSYTEANQIKTGYAPEPWHYRYYGLDLAKDRHEQALRGE